MEKFEGWIDQLGPVGLYSLIAVVFLTASIAGWYAVNWILRLRR